MPCFSNPPGRGGWVKKNSKAVTASYLCYSSVTCLEPVRRGATVQCKATEENTVEYLKETGHNKRSLLRLA